MNYKQRKMAIAQKEAKRYSLKALMYNLVVVLSSINILGSCMAAVSSPIYFLLNTAISIIVIRTCYREAVCLEKKSARVIRDCQRKLRSLKSENVPNNIIHINFDFKKNVYLKSKSTSDII